MVPFFVERLAAGGTRPALLIPDRATVTYDQLAERVARQALVFGPEKRLIAIDADLSEHAIIAYLAALACGHTIALLAPGDVTVSARFKERFEPDIHFRQHADRWRADETAQSSSGVLHPDLALLLSTSGSTGEGKYVRLSAANLAANAASIAQYLRLDSNDRGTLVLPLHYSYGLSVLNSHLAVHGGLYLPGKSILDAGFLDDLRENRCTSLPGVPFSFELFEKIGFRDHRLPSLRMMTVAGGRLPAELARLYRDHLARRGGELFVMYGQTEATARIAFVPPHLLDGNPDSIGIAIPDGELALVDDDGGVIRDAETPGELVYRGPNVMMGYAASRADLNRGSELAELRTGDLAVRNRDGLYRIAGRLSRMSKIAGLRIGHDALEQALASAGIKAAVFGDDQGIAAAYTTALPEDVVRKKIIEVSGLTAMHVAVTRRDTLPRLVSGKIDYRRLKSDHDDGQFRRTENVREAFREAFFPQRTEDQDTFVSLGGDSLRYVRLSLNLERILNDLPEGWENLPIAELATMQQAKTRTQSLGTDLVIRALAILLVVIQHATIWPVPGGAAAMVMLIGYSLARFQSGNLFAGHTARVFRPVLSVLVPYYLIIALYALVWGKVPWVSVFLLGNFGLADPAERTMLPFLYWFVEAYVQMVAIWAVLFAMPAMRKAGAKKPYLVGLAMLALAMVLRFAGPLLWPLGDREVFTVPWIFYLTVFGWLAYFADNASRKIVLFAVGAVTFPLVAYYGGNWIGSWVKYMMQLGFLAALLFAPRMPMPRWVAGLVLPISAASYYIYLFHRFVPELVLAPLEAELPWSVFCIASIAGGIAVGLLARELLKNLPHWSTLVRLPLIVWRKAAALPGQTA
ncbi:AMP-binding protein [Phyllobacterium lublinensis]|uniref:AMP-binding protein n=1 Tax=Phyllobacterium lublinensis TaxID=2875708 RepID=UPI001CCAA267|nr:AMP-binding protein [Phyllobacterium sp. 2063]MBZ9656685.1 AMP-binding protein [Phyllobacterium sp. 2063]